MKMLMPAKMSPEGPTDKEMKDGPKEGSKKEEAMDRKMAMKAPPPRKKGPPRSRMVGSDSQD